MQWAWTQITIRSMTLKSHLLTRVQGHLLLAQEILSIYRLLPRPHRLREPRNRQSLKRRHSFLLDFSMPFLYPVRGYALERFV